MNQLPGWYSSKCTCRRGYFVLNRDSEDLLCCPADITVADLEEMAKKEATNLGYVFIDTGVQPFLLCACGVLLNALPYATASEMMM